LEDGASLSDHAKTHPPPPPRSDLTDGLLELLQLLDVAASSADRSKTLGRFYGSEQHRALIQWQANLADEFSRNGRDKTLDALIASLLNRMEEASMGTSGRERVYQSIEVVAGSTVAVADIAVGGPGLISYVSGALASIPVIRGGLRALGYVSTEYNGPHWPFLYLGLRRNRRNIQKLQGVLNDQMSRPIVE
jgi:hypothetical protein